VKYKLVQGTQDFLPKQLKEKIFVQERIMNMFAGFGYDAVLTPLIEHHEVFTEGEGVEPLDQLFKLSDTDGSLLVLRSDMTTPLSRIVSTKLPADFPLRLCYLANSYKLKAERNRLREFTQAGVELFGISAPFADAEVIALAIDALTASGLRNFQIDIGEVGILKGVLDSTPLGEAQKAKVFSFIDKKNFIDKNVFSLLDAQTRSLINDLTNMFGDSQMLDCAESILTNEKSLQALANLRQVYKILQAMGYGQYISFDLGIVNTYTYYTGIVFKGITRFLGTPILSGGRYDTLTRSFDKDIPATGFAIGIDNLCIALSREGSIGNADNNKNIIAIGMQNTPSAYTAYRKVCKQLTEAGNIVDYSYTADIAALREYADSKGISEIIFIDAQGMLAKEKR
jgi:ATP phosphoribosyltransferase regulatory subunit